MVFNQTEKQERSYLQQIITRLKQIISHTDVSVKDHVDTLAEYKDYLWNNKDIDPHEIRSMRESILNHFAIEQILSEVLNHKYKYLSFFEQVNELLTKPTPDFIERIEYKSSFDFIASLDRFILHIENHYFRAEDVKLTKHITVPAEFIEEQFHRFNRCPMRQRFEAMTDYILDMMKVQYAFTVMTAERNFLKKEIKRMFAGNNDLQVYKDFFAWLGKPELFKMRKNRALEYADLAPLAYLHIALDGGTKNDVKHLLVDEMQDYSPIQYKIIQKLFPCRKTVLGDASQSVNPYGSSTADMIHKALVTGDVMKLCKSYRSTCEITDFAQQIRTNTDLEPVARHGEKPRMLRYNNEKEELSAIKELIATYQASAYKSLGIVCKTESQAREMAVKLQIPDSHFLSSQSSAFVQGIIITSAHMAKGLEFDEVIIPQMDDRNYHSEIDRSMLYVAVTRAMHRLTLTYSGTKHTPFI